jgi:hypothetical protein
MIKLHLFDGFLPHKIKFWYFEAQVLCFCGFYYMYLLQVNHMLMLNFDAYLEAQAL